MLRTVVLSLLASCLYAQSVSLLAVSNVRAVVRATDPSGACTVTLRENSSTGAIHSEYNGVADNTLPDFYTWANGTRIISMPYLAADRDYHLTLSGCMSATLTFRTGTVTLGDTAGIPVPQNASHYNGAKYPAFDWSIATGRDKWYIDPATGVRMRPIIRPGDFGRKSQDDQTFLAWSGGGSWSNPGNALNGITSTAQVSDNNTNSIVLYAAPTNAWQEIALENIGALVYGSCVSGDCALEVGITKDGGATFSGTPIPLTAPGGAMAKISGGSAHSVANGAFPTDYPKPLFLGWGNVRLTRNDLPVAAQVTVTSGTVQIDATKVSSIHDPGNNKHGHFPLSLAAGHKISIADSGCTSGGATNMCTVATVVDADTITITESISVSDKVAISYPWGIMIRKANTNTGTIQIGAQYRWAGTSAGITTPAVAICGGVERTDADGVKGEACLIPYQSSEYTLLYFISHDGSIVRPVSAFVFDGLGNKGADVRFSPSDGNVFYFRSLTNNSYRAEYTGDWKTSVWNDADGYWGINQGGDIPGGADPYLDITQILVTPLADQVDDLFPQYGSSSVYGSWSTGVSLVATTGDLILYQKLPWGQDKVGLIAVVHLPTDTLIDVFDTMDLADTSLTYGGAHGIGPGMVNNSVEISTNYLNNNNTGFLSGGPYQMPIEAVLVSGSWDTNKALPWPVDSSYDNTCPTPPTIPQRYADYGATGSSCIVFRTTGEPCNIAPNGTADPATGDYAKYGACPWNAAYAAGPPLRIGMRFVDQNQSGCNSLNLGDCESFKVLLIQDEGGGKKRITAQRNAPRDYCCAGNGTANPSSSYCAQSDNQLQHNANFTAMMLHGEWACSEGRFYRVYNNAPLTTDTTWVEASRTYHGHTASGYANGRIRFLGNQLVREMDSITDLGIQPPIPGKTTPFPLWNGIQLGVGSRGIQSYLRHTHSLGAGPDSRFSLDANHLNGGLGLGGNLMENVIGSRTLTNVSGDIWKTTIVGTLKYKLAPPVGWSGAKMLADVSGTDITAAADYSFCVVYKDEDCYTGSVVADGAYLKIPKVYKSTYAAYANACQTGMEFANTPCVVAGEPGAGYIRQFGSDASDPVGYWARVLTTGLRPPGTHFPYWAAQGHTRGKMMLFASGGNVEGVRNVTWLAKLPPYSGENHRKPGFVDYQVKVPPIASMTHARVAFGYNKDLYCTGRQKKCYTDGTMNTGDDPFAFEDDTLDHFECDGATGCTVTVPAHPGRVMYRRLEYSTNNGSSWNAWGEIIPVLP